MVRFPAKPKFLRCQQYPAWLYGPPIFLFNGYRWLVLQDQRVKLTIHLLLLRLRMSRLIYINNCPTRCNTNSLFIILQVHSTCFGCPLIIRSTQNCNYSLRYWSYFLCSYLPPTWPSLTWPRWSQYRRL